MPKKRANRKGARRMSDNHEHTPEQPQGRQPNPYSFIAVLNQRLDQRANELRRLEDADSFKAALINDLTADNAGIMAALDQVAAENRILRQRLGLPEQGVLELTEQESALQENDHSDTTKE